MQRLDPASRALLELSFVHRLGDEELASMLATDPAGVRERRERVMRELGASAEDERAALAAALDNRVAPGMRVLQLLLGDLLILLAVASTLWLGRDEDEAEPSLSPEGEHPQPRPPVAAGAVKLEPIAEGRGSASARIVEDRRGPRLRLTVRHLPRPSSGGYVGWLYDSVSEARALTGSRRGSFTVTVPLPPAASRYRFLVLSREPADRNRNHSGESLLRLALTKIRRR